MWLDNASDVDILFYEPYADVITEITQNKDYNPLTIGVFGVWGAGKSTLLNLIQQKIKKLNKADFCASTHCISAFFAFKSVAFLATMKSAACDILIL